MTDYEKVMRFLRDEATYIRGQWNGDEPGEQEDRAGYASELLDALSEVDKYVKELDI